jgi:hypothetical protein
MGEGWGDFHALLMLVREEDQNVTGNDQWQGAYGAGTYATPAFTSDPIWFGIRRVTYSTDFHKNGTTFKFINTAFDPADLDFPWGGSAGDDPTEVHNTGEIWASMLWESYASLLTHHPFAEAQQRMKDYLVAAYKVTPAFPTFVEARDAVLQVAAANDDADYQLIGEAFARRGLGVGAVAPDRADPDHAGLVEDFTWGTNVRIESVAVVDGPTNCDGDGILDAGEVGLVQVTLRNVGKDTVTGVTGTVESSDTGVTFPDGAGLTFSSIAPGATGVATAKIALSGVTDPGEISVTASVEGSTLTTTPQTGEAGGVLVNFDDVASLTTDGFEAVNTNWTLEFAQHGQTNPALSSWFRAVLDPPNRSPGWVVFQNIQADESLISPPIQVGGTGDFVLSWSSLFAILPNGAPPTPYLGGVVVEITTDDGAHWVDIADASLAADITNGYTHEVVERAGAIPQYQSPLAGRMAFTAADASAAAFRTTTVNFHGGLGTATVRVRFRYGGWLRRLQHPLPLRARQLRRQRCDEHPIPGGRRRSGRLRADRQRRARPDGERGRLGDPQWFGVRPGRRGHQRMDPDRGAGRHAEQHHGDDDLLHRPHGGSRHGARLPADRDRHERSAQRRRAHHRPRRRKSAGGADQRTEQREDGTGGPARRQRVQRPGPAGAHLRLEPELRASGYLQLDDG